MLSQSNHLVSYRHLLITYIVQHAEQNQSYLEKHTPHPGSHLAPTGGAA